MNNKIEGIWKEAVLAPTILDFVGILPVSSGKWRNSTSPSFEATQALALIRMLQKLTLYSILYDSGVIENICTCQA